MDENQMARLEVAFLLAAAELGYPSDMQGTLVHGSDKYGIPRGVLRAGLWAVLLELGRIDKEENAARKATA